MKKNIKKIIKKNYKRTDLLKDLKLSLLNFSFVMIYIIQKMLALLKNHLNYLKDNIFECFLRSFKETFNLFFKKIFFCNI